MGYYCEGDGGQSRGSIVTKVLIVDDDAGVLRMVGWVLRTEGFEVATATDGEEGLRKVEADLPDVIVTDLQMPVLDGEGFCRELRAREVDVPILILAAHGARRALATCDAQAYLDKPFETDALVSAVQRLVA